jgi:hypothetical protein
MLKQGTIEELKSLVAKGDGFAHTNLYYVLFPRDVIVGDQDPYVHGVLCTSVTLPSKQLMTVNREIGMIRQEVVHGFVEPNVSMTFRILNDQSTRKYFDAWQKRALAAYPNEEDALEGRFEVNYPSEYMRQIKIFQLKKGISFPVFNKFADKDLGPINLVFDLDLDIGTKLSTTYEWTLDRAYPVSITNETLTDGAQNEISTITVEFSFEKWRGRKFESDDATAKKLAKLVGTIASIFN